MQQGNYVVTLAAFYQYWLERGWTITQVDARALVDFPGLPPQSYRQARAAALQGINVTQFIDQLLPYMPLYLASTRRPPPTGPVSLRYLVTLEDSAGHQDQRQIYIVVDWSMTKGDVDQFAADQIARSFAGTGFGAGFTFVSAQLIPTIY